MKHKISALKLMALVVAMALPAVSAKAATCSFGKTTYTLTQGVPDAVLGAECYGGNDSGNDGVADGMLVFGFTDWALGQKVEKNGSSTGGGAVSFGIAPIAFSSPWSVLNPLGYEYVMVALKQANSFGAFLLDTTKALSGTWLTEGGDLGDLSHASVYYRGNPGNPGGEEPPPVPLPAAAWFLIAGVGGLAALRRKRG